MSIAFDCLKLLLEDQLEYESTDGRTLEIPVEIYDNKIYLQISEGTLEIKDDGTIVTHCNDLL